MKKVKQISKWVALIGFILFGLMCLYEAFISLLLSSSTTTACPDFKIWEHRSIIQFGYGFASISTSIMAFVALKDGFSFKTSKLKYLWLIIVLVCFLYPEYTEWLEIDRCLDSGGQWNAEYFECSD